MIEATSCGGVVIFRGKILLLYKNYKNKYEGWVLPKGTVEAGEEFQDTATREVLEETGATASIVKYVGKSQYTFTVPEDTVEKEVHWYLMMADSYYSKPQREEYFVDSGFYKYHEAYHLLKFSNEKQILEKAYNEYLELKKNKLSDKFESDVLRKRLEELQQFLTQPLCRETFIIKSVIYNYINRFWDGKCFLLRANAKKDMRAVFEKDFSEPFHKYLEGEHKKAKDTCIDCGNGITGKEKVSIAFMKEMADDLTRKRSAFWNCQVDAFLCPVCAFVYALSPLGFQIYANKFVFMNLNENISVLLDVNGKKRGNGLKEKGEEENYTVWFARILNKVLSDKVKELNNVQVILRGTRAEDNYMFSIIGRDAIQILKQEKVQKALKYLEQHPYVKLSNEFVNVHESVVMNILQYHKQYSLLNQILKESLENTGVIPTAYWVYVVQLCTSIEKRMEVNVGSISEELEQSQQGIEEKLSKAKERIFMSRIKMRDAGYKLRKEILLAKKAENDECMRGTIYQLLNALSVRNEGKFMDIVIRLYSSTKLPMADGFVYMLGNKEKFSEYGYSFILGLKGSYVDSKDNKSEDAEQSQDESGEEK